MNSPVDRCTRNCASRLRSFGFFGYSLGDCCESRTIVVQRIDGMEKVETSKAALFHEHFSFREILHCFVAPYNDERVGFFLAVSFQISLLTLPDVLSITIVWVHAHIHKKQNTKTDIGHSREALSCSCLRAFSLVYILVERIDYGYQVFCKYYCRV
jgi:hypothetical protein